MVLDYVLADDSTAREKLATLFRWRNETQRQIDQYPNDLKGALRIMEHLGLTEYEGRTLAGLKAQLAYQGRTFFTRCLRVGMEAGGYSYSNPAGLDQPWGFPKLYGWPKFTFELRSDDGCRRISVTINTESERDSTLFADAELHVRFRPKDVFFARAATHIGLYRRKKGYGPEDSVSHNHMGDWVTRIDAAFRVEGFDGVWRTLDWIWLDLASSRPMTRPLKPLSLEARYGPHNGQAVKVFGPTRTVAGIWQHTVRKTDGTISAVRIVPVSKPDTTFEIPADEIFELLPCRLDREV